MRLLRFSPAFAGLLALSSLSHANTEKAVFKVRPDTQSNDAQPNAARPPIFPPLHHIRNALSMSSRIASEHISVMAAAEADGSPRQSWFLLKDLPVGRVFEVRACWPASEPSAITVDVFHPSDLPADLSAQISLVNTHSQALSTQSLLLRLQIEPESTPVPGRGTARPPVPVDIVLDPFLFNAIPESLLPTIAYILGSASLAAVISPRLYKYISTCVLEQTKQHID